MIIWRTATSSLLSINRFTGQLNYWILEFKEETVKMLAFFCGLLQYIFFLPLEEGGLKVHQFHACIHTKLDKITVLLSIITEYEIEMNQTQGIC